MLAGDSVSVHKNKGSSDTVGKKAGGGGWNGLERNKKQQISFPLNHWHHQRQFHKTHGKRNHAVLPPGLPKRKNIMQV